MEDLTTIQFSVLAIFCLVLPSLGSETCSQYFYGGSQIYCSSGCCGYYYRYCCYYYSYYIYSGTANVGAIIGGVIGGLVALGILIFFFIMICQQCNKHTTRGAVIAPQVQTHQVQIIPTISQQMYPMYGNHIQHPATGPVQPPPPPAYEPPPQFPPQPTSEALPPPSYAENVTSSEPPNETLN